MVVAQVIEEIPIEAQDIPDTTKEIEETTEEIQEHINSADDIPKKEGADPLALKISRSQSQLQQLPNLKQSLKQRSQ